MKAHILKVSSWLLCEHECVYCVHLSPNEFMLS